MVPPNDNEHGCAWKDYATHLESKLQGIEADLAALKRTLFDKSSEKKKSGKMPRIKRPPKTREAIQATRQAQAIARTERVVVDETVIRVPEADKKCTLCGDTDFRKLGDGKTSVLIEYVTGYFRRVVTRRETLACRCGGHVVTAPAPERWTEKTRYGASFVANLVVSKCLVVTPHYRREQEFARAGVPIARSTMNDLFRKAAQKLLPLEEPLFKAIAKDHRVHADETSFRMTKQSSKAFMWAFVGAQLTGYRFALTRKGDVPIDILGDSEGLLVCDDYRGYDPAVRRGRRRRCGCLAHARRKFFDAGEDPDALEALDLIGSIYSVEHEAELQGIVGTEAHRLLRRTVSRPLFLRLLIVSRELRRAHGPKTLLGRAARYTWRNQKELGVFLRDVKAPLDNNWAENALRIVALGRKNFLFVHSEAAGKELALLYSLVVSCGRVGVNPVEYLTDVLDRIDRVTRSKLADLLPHRWKPQRKAAVPIEF